MTYMKILKNRIKPETNSFFIKKKFKIMYDYYKLFQTSLEQSAPA